MALKEYRLHGHTYLFDSEDVPEGAELVGDQRTPKPVVLFPDQADRKRGRGKANKAAPAPEDKSDTPDAGKVLEEPNKPEEPAGDPSTED